MPPLGKLLPVRRWMDVRIVYRWKDDETRMASHSGSVASGCGWWPSRCLFLWEDVRQRSFPVGAVLFLLGFPAPARG